MEVKPISAEIKASSHIRINSNVTMTDHVWVLCLYMSLCSERYWSWDSSRDWRLSVSGGVFSSTASTALTAGKNRNDCCDCEDWSCSVDDDEDDDEEEDAAASVEF